MRLPRPVRRLVARLTWHRRADPALVATIRRSGLFDPRWYRGRYLDSAGYPAGPLAHFCQHGVHEGRDPGPLFSTETYRARSPEKLPAGESAFLHAMRHRRPDEAYLWTPSTEEALRRPIHDSGLFDAAFYLDRYPDIARATSKPFEHYIRYGRVEERAPGPGFDPDDYADRYPEYRKLFPTTIEHFVLYGRPRGLVGHGGPIYRRWIELHDALTPQDEAAIRAEAERDPLPPVTILCLVDAAAAARLDGLLESFRNQIGADWHAILVPARGLAAEDWRRCRTIIEGDARLRCDDTLRAVLAALPDRSSVILCAGPAIVRPHAAYVFARWLRAQAADALYADHDRLLADGRSMPRFKPAFSPEYLGRSAYVGPVIAFRDNPATRSALAAAFDETAELAGLPSAFLQKLDPASIGRVPFVLHHVPGDAPSTAPAQGPTVSGPEGETPTVSIVIPTRDRLDVLRPCIESILAETDYAKDRYEIVVVDNGSEKPETQTYFDEISARGVRIVPSPGPFNYSAINNAGVAASKAEILVFLNNDTTVKRADWLGVLVAHARRPEIGAVGPMLLYPDDTVQHAGVVLGVHGVGIHRLGGVRFAAIETSEVTREISAVTGACLAIRRALFLELGGFDPSLEVNFNDTKLCAQALVAGYRNLYVAEPLLYHHESKSRGYNDSPEKLDRLYREAAALIGQYPSLFRDDPAYSPNLSLTRLDDPAFPPRIVRPWRRSRDMNRVLLLSLVHGQGFGVPVVLAMQAQALVERGFEVIVGGPVGERDTAYPGCRRVALAEARAAANFAVSEGVDVIVAHTQPFFSVARLVGAHPLCVFVDHGEPSPDLFPDKAGREAVNREKRLSAAFAHRVFCISRTIYGQQFRKDAIVIRNGSTHLTSWDADWAARRDVLRERFNLTGRFVILNVCRFTAAERAYKGVDRYVEIAQEFGLLHPDLKERCIFALVGRGEPADVVELERAGLRVMANVSNDDMSAIYAAADIYANFSKWEGYNLGIGQALAMGLTAVASDIEAHHEFPIVTSNSTITICTALAAVQADWATGALERKPIVDSWKTTLDLFCDTLEADLSAAPGPWGETARAGGP